MTTPKVTIIIQAHSLLLLSPYGNRAISRYPADAETRPSDRWHGIHVQADTVPLRESVATLLAGMTVSGVRFIRRCTVGAIQAGYGDIGEGYPDLAGEPDAEPTRRVGNPQYASLTRKLYSARAALSRAKSTTRTRGHAIPIPVLEARVQACRDALTAYEANTHDDSRRTPVERIQDDVNGLYMACRSRSLLGTRNTLPDATFVQPENAVNFWDAQRATGTPSVPSVKRQRAQSVNAV